MGIRKLAAVAVMTGAVSAAGLGMAGAASATTLPSLGNTTNNNCSYGNNCNKLYTKVSAQKTVVKDSNVTGVKISQKSDNSGNVTNTQTGVAVAVPVNVQGQVPINAGGNSTLAQKGVDSEAKQNAEQKQYNSAEATANKSSISTSVNSNKGVANGVSVNIGGSAQTGDNSSGGGWN